VTDALENNMSWKAVFRLEVEECPTFKEAVKSLWRRIMNSDVLMHFDLDQAAWIETNTKGDLPIHFFVARDIAAENGWFDEFEKEDSNGNIEANSPANSDAF